MLRNKIKVVSGMFCLFLLSLISCEKTTTVVVNAGSTITQTMSFSKDIVPIFSASCAKSGCHNSGAKSPDLSTANAYKALTVGGYIKANDPDNSTLMQWLNGKKSPVMPLGAGPDDKINAKIYAWIKQGAKNN